MKGLNIMLAAGLALTAGCAQVPLTAQQVRIPTLQQQVGVREMDSKMVMRHKKIVETLGITQAQLQQMKTIKQSYKGRLMAEKGDELTQQFKDLFLAKDVDETAMRNFLVERRNAWEQKLPIVVNMMSELRGVLAEDQRTKLVDLIDGEDFSKIHQERKDKIFNKLLKDLNLTSVQEEALDALKDKIDSAHTPQKIAAMKSALIAFIQTGNEADLTNAFTEHLSESPMDQFVSFVGSLSQEQRVTILNRVEAWKAKMKAMKAKMKAMMEK